MRARGVPPEGMTSASAVRAQLLERRAAWRKAGSPPGARVAPALFATEDDRTLEPQDVRRHLEGVAAAVCGAERPRVDQVADDEWVIVIRDSGSTYEQPVWWVPNASVTVREIRDVLAESWWGSREELLETARSLAA